MFFNGFVFCFFRIVRHRHVQVEKLVGDEVEKDDVKTFFEDADLDQDGKLSYDE